MASTISVVDLPPEITSVIFVHCIQVYEDEWYYEERLPGLSPRAAPLLLGRICRQWRSIAWSTPALWNAIQVHCPYYIEDVVPALQRWLLRAGSLPLTIDLRYIAHPGTSSDGILDLLQRHSEQLQDLTLNIDPEDYFRLAEILGPLPLLQKIFFTCRRLRDYDGMQITAFRIAPRLIDVHFLANFSPINIDLPWEQLTTFRADSLTVAKCLLVLSLAPNLVTGRFEYRATSGPLVDVPPLLHLKSLILQGMEASTKLLAHLTTPALVYLEVEQLDLDLWTAFRSLLDPGVPSTTLRSLQLGGPPPCIDMDWTVSPPCLNWKFGEWAQVSTRSSIF